MNLMNKQRNSGASDQGWETVTGGTYQLSVGGVNGTGSAKLQFKGPDGAARDIGGKAVFGSTGNEDGDFMCIVTLGSCEIRGFLDTPDSSDVVSMTLTEVAK